MQLGFLNLEDKTSTLMLEDRKKFINEICNITFGILI